MTNWLLTPFYWNWFLAGLILILLEIMLPGTFLVWLGIAALGVGLLVLIFPALGWAMQLLAFALFAVSSIVLYLRFFKDEGASSAVLLNRRGQQYIGRSYTLDQPIVNGYGRLHIDDSIWKICGPDCPRGSRVRIIGLEGISLRVELIAGE